MNDVGRFGVFTGVVEMQLEVRASGALLIRGPDAFTVDAPDMAFVRYPIDGVRVPYLPGSSLKGVLRSGAEALLRGLGREACTTWRDTCWACLTFGSTRGASVVLVDDGLPWPPGAGDTEKTQAFERLERGRTIRTSVAIDRQAGAVAAGPFDYEALVRPQFYPTVRLRNPAPWQAALVAASFGLLDGGILRLGGMTSKGLGRVEVDVRSVEIVAVRDGLADLWEADWTVEPVAPPLVRRRAPSSREVVERWRSRLENWLAEAPV